MQVMWRRFWFRSRQAVADYTPEVLHAGWVPQLPVSAVLTAAAAPVSPALSASEGSHCLAGKLATELSNASADAAVATAVPTEADVGDLLVRFYANQAC